MNKYTEAELAEKIIKHLEKLGWLSYKEVSLKGSGGNIRSDCFFVKKENDKVIESLALETKLSFSFKVLEQADKWLPHANKSYICIPSPKKLNRKNLKFGLKICKKLNIGVFEVNMKDGTIKELYSPDTTLKIKLPPLYELQRESIAGNDKSSFITAFKITVMNINEYMKDKNEIDLNDIIDEITHHYKTKTSAVNTIKKLIKEGIIKGYFLKKIDNKTLLNHNIC